MSSTIQPLPSEVVHLIAAGEVIDSLAAVVRELVENSLDAGAARIVVSLWPDQWRVRVADNGCGMALVDLQQAATAHSTSKIRSCEDLWKITSLGFRGEALHSLAQLGELEILSRRSKSSEGWRVVYSTQGEPLQVVSAAIAPGTVVTVSNLFGTWPVRRQGLPKLAQQMKAVQTTIGQIALCHPHVTWLLWQNDREWFTLSPGATTQQLLPQLLRQVRMGDLQQLKIEVPTPREAGGAGEQGSRGAGEQRGQGDKETRGQGENYELTSPHPPCPLIPRGDPEFPPSPHPLLPLPSSAPLPLTPSAHNSSLLLVLGLPDRCHRHRPDWVRVAINGRMVKSPELEQTILAATSRTLPRDRYPVCFLHLQICPSQINWNRHPAKAEIYLHHLSHWQEQVILAIEQALRISPANLPEAVHIERVGKLLKAAEEKGVYAASRSIHPITSSPPHPSIQLQAVAQVHNTYILAEHSGGLWLVEQHIAHERVLYEQLLRSWQLVPLESPAILNQLSLAQRSQLQRIGLEVEPFGDQLWAARNAPALLQKRADCAEALLELSWGGDLQAAQVATACRSAIRNGTPLSLQDMQTLLDEWQSTRNPRTCPHGRPIYLSLEESALARYFRRNWVIGKSHGI